MVECGVYITGSLCVYTGLDFLVILDIERSLLSLVEIPYIVVVRVAWTGDLNLEG